MPLFDKDGQPIKSDRSWFPFDPELTDRENGFFPAMVRCERSREEIVGGDPECRAQRFAYMVDRVNALAGIWETYAPGLTDTRADLDQIDQLEATLQGTTNPTTRAQLQDQIDTTRAGILERFRALLIEITANVQAFDDIRQQHRDVFNELKIQIEGFWNVEPDFAIRPMLRRRDREKETEGERPYGE